MSKNNLEKTLEDLILVLDEWKDSLTPEQYQAMLDKFEEYKKEMEKK